MLKTIFIIAALVLTQSAFALNSLTCHAQMLGKTNNASKSSIAPVLSGQGLNSVIRAKHNTDSLYLHFNTQTVSHSKAHVILDGRYRNILMNTHLSVEEKNNIISITMRDTVTHKIQTNEFHINSNISIRFDNGSALFELDCSAI